MSVALAPLAVGIALDSYLAVGRMIGLHVYAVLAAVVIFVILIAAGFLTPVWIRLHLPIDNTRRFNEHRGLLAE